MSAPFKNRSASGRAGISCFLFASLAGLATLSAQAQLTLASDNAGNYSSWPQTANNGAGFGSWSFNNPTPNGGYAGEFLGGSYTSNGGGINSGNGNAFGFYANSGNYAEAQALTTFSAGALTAGETFSVQMQNHYIGDAGGQEGFSLQNSSGNNLIQFYFNGGASDYYLSIWTAIATPVQVDTGVNYTSGPLTLNYTQGAGTAWSFAILEGATTVGALSSASTGDALWQNSVSQVNLYSLNGGDSGNQNDNVYFNNLSVTAPEPTTLALSGLSALALLALRHRRK
jgi:hypothetical protein